MNDSNFFKNGFKQIFLEFKQTELFQTMCQTVEDSPYHREANVGVHTEMVIDQYLTITADIEWTVDHFIGALVCMFHDVGKPKSMTEELHEDGRTIRKFKGHEGVSARMCEDYLVTNWLNQHFDDYIEVQDVYGIIWLIEHHLPYSTINESKRSSLKATVNSVLMCPEVFEYILRADQQGRISDNQQDKLAKMEEWFIEFNKVIPYTPPTPNEGDKFLCILVGPSSTGKSTATNMMLENEVTVFSWDAERLRLYPAPEHLNEAERYSYSWARANEDENFYNECFKRFALLCKSGVHIILDNTNLTDKRRNQFADIANRENYTISVCVIPSNIALLQFRNTERGDRSLPESVIKNQYESVRYPTIGPLCQYVVALDQNFPNLYDV